MALEDFIEQAIEAGAEHLAKNYTLGRLKECLVTPGAWKPEALEMFERAISKLESKDEVVDVSTSTRSPRSEGIDGLGLVLSLSNEGLGL